MGTPQHIIESLTPTSTRFPQEKVLEGKGYQFADKFEGGISCWNEYELMSVDKAPDRGPYVWIMRWEFKRRAYWSQNLWVEFTPTNPEALIPITEELPEPKKRPAPPTTPENDQQNLPEPNKRSAPPTKGEDAKRPRLPLWSPSGAADTLPHNDKQSTEVLTITSDTQEPP